MKPLETGRRIFSWFCSEAIDEPLSRCQVVARAIFLFIFGVNFIATVVVVNLSLLTTLTSVKSVDAIFIGCYQLIATLYSTSAITATFGSGSKLASLFRSLENIYEACKGNAAFI